MYNFSCLNYYILVIMSTLINYFEFFAILDLTIYLSSFYILGLIIIWGVLTANCCERFYFWVCFAIIMLLYLTKKVKTFYLSFFRNTYSYMSHHSTVGMTDLML